MQLPQYLPNWKLFLIYLLINCNSILANESLRPFKLKTHFNNIHGGKGTEEEMKVKRARFDQKGSLTGFGFVKHEKPVLEASYEVAYLIAREKASFSSGEKLINWNEIYN